MAVYLATDLPKPALGVSLYWAANPVPTSLMFDDLTTAQEADELF